MDTTVIYATLIYFMSFRLSIILLGGISIYLGYKLFSQSMSKGRKTDSNTNAEMEARFGDKQLTLKNAAPGTFFAAFGALIVIVVLAGNPPVFTLKTNDATSISKNSNAPISEGKQSNIAQSDQKPSVIAQSTSTEMTVRSDELPETAESANQLSDQYFKQSLRLAEHAEALNPQNADYQDSLAGLYFINGQFDLAIQHQEKAVKLAPERKDLQKRLKAYQHIGQME